MKKAVSSGLMIIGIMVFISSCTQKGSDKSFIEFVEKQANGYHKIVEAGEIIYDLQYKPARYIAYKESGDSNRGSSEFKKRIDNLKGTVWFNIKLDVKASEVNPLKYDVTNLGEYNTRLAYFLREAGRNFTLSYNGMEIGNPNSYLFENNYTLTPYDVIIVGFKIPDAVPKEDITLVYEDKVFNNGLIKFKITREEFSALEQIN